MSSSRNLALSDTIETQQKVDPKPRCPACGCFWNGEACFFCDHPAGAVTYRCPHCNACLENISLPGRQNHIEICGIKHIPVRVRP